MILASHSVTKSLKLLHIRKSGPDIVGSMESRGKIFKYTDLISSSEDEDKDNISIGDKKDAEVDTVAEVSNSFRPSASSEATSRICDAKADADITSMHKVRKLPRDLLWFAQWVFGADGISSLQVLAYGDFSFEGRFGSENHVL